MNRVIRAIAIVAAFAGVAHANGRPPEPTALHFGVNANDMYLQVTFGMLESHDGGATWRWVCEDAINYSGNYDPDYTVSSTGALFATTFDGLQVRRDGCVFGPTALSNKLVTSITSNPAGTTLYAAVGDTTNNDHNVYVSTDDGMQWNPSSTGLGGTEVWWSSLEVAPSNPKVVYLSGYSFPSAGTRTDSFYKSVDAGATWTPIATTPFAMTNNSEIKVASISPDDANFLLAAVTYPKSSSMIGVAIWRSVDGGDSWTQVKELDDYVDGIVIRHYAGSAADAPTKAEVVIGTRASGMWDSTDGGKTFIEVAQPPPAGTAIETRCMAEHNGVLWACGNDLPPDDMALGKSTTPASWTTVLRFKDIAGTVQCPGGTKEQDVCNLTRWCGLRNQLGIVANPTNCTSAGADGAPMDAVSQDGNGTHTSPKGCCDAGGEPASAIVLSLFGFAALLRPRSHQRRHQS
jgi:photosystem II stability/assembly factor-like uncharacterized protein